MHYMQHMTNAEFIRHLEGGDHSSKEVQALLERLRQAEDKALEYMALQEQMDALMCPAVSKAVVWKGGTTHVALFASDDWEAARELMDADGYTTERDPLFWAPQFITAYERELAAAAYPKVVYRTIDVWGKLLDQQVGEPVPEFKPILRTRTRNAVTAKPTVRRRTRNVR